MKFAMRASLGLLPRPTSTCCRTTLQSVKLTRSERGRYGVQRLLEGSPVQPLPHDHAGDQQTGHEDERKTEDEEPAHWAEGSRSEFTQPCEDVGHGSPHPGERS